MNGEPFNVVRTMLRAIGAITDNARPMAALAMLMIFAPSVIVRYLRGGAFGGGELAGLLGAAAPLLSTFLYCAFAAIVIRYTLVVLRGGTIVPGGEAEMVRRHLPVILVFTLLTYLFHLSYALTIPGMVAITLCSVAVAVEIDERGGIIRSFRRSLDLTRGSRWAMLRLLLLFVIVVIGSILPLAVLDVRQHLHAFGPAADVMFIALLRTAIWTLAATSCASLYHELLRLEHGDRPLAEIFT